MFNLESTRSLQGLFCRVVFQTGGFQSVFVHVVVPPQVQDFAHPIVELYEVSVSPLLQLVKVPLNGSITLWCINHSS